MDIDAVTNLGHAGRFVKTETGYVFFELTGLPDNPVPGGKIQDDPEKTGGIIPSNGPLLYPRPSLAGSSGKEDGAILSVSMSLGENLTVYDVFGNNCGTAARDALTTPKSGLNYNIYPGGPFSMVHTAIGSLLELLRVA
jgi:hypothetical protein